MTFITFCSTLAIFIGLFGVVPQIAAMLRSRSSAGQSSVGWSMGAAVNVMMAYVNFAGYDAVLLTAGNVAGATLCAVALLCVVRLRARADAPSVLPGSADTFAALEHDEFWALRDIVLEEAARRSAPREAAAA